MKSYKHLYDKYISEENIRQAVISAARGQKSKRAKAELINIRDHVEQFLPQIRHYAENFYNMNHTPVEMNDGIAGKTRIIIVPTPMEQIVHHMIVNILQPIFSKEIYAHSYAAMPGRGTHKGKKYLERQIRKGGKNVKYVLKMDVKQYFATIPHDKLKARLAYNIKDQRFLNVLYTLIDVQKVGLPLGFFTSQWLANWYLAPLDRFIKEQLGIKTYVRYMDDEVMTGHNKKRLHDARKKIAAFLESELGLRMKENWQVYRFNIKHRFFRDIDFMGFRFYRDRTTIRKSILKRLKRSIRATRKGEKVSLFQIRRVLSYLGWVSHTDTYNMYLRFIKPFVNIQKFKRRIANYDRRKNLCPNPA